MKIGCNWGVLRVAVVGKGIISAHGVAFQLLISCQAEKQPERKDTHRKPLLPHLRIADVFFSFF